MRRPAARLVAGLVGKDDLRISQQKHRHVTRRSDDGMKPIDARVLQAELDGLAHFDHRPRGEHLDVPSRVARFPLLLLLLLPLHPLQRPLIAQALRWEHRARSRTFRLSSGVAWSRAYLRHR